MKPRIEWATTPAQERVLAALRTLTDDGWPASVRDVMREAGLLSPTTPFDHLLALERIGLAERHPRNRRGGWRAVKLIEVSFEVKDGPDAGVFFGVRRADG